MYSWSPSLAEQGTCPIRRVCIKCCHSWLIHTWYTDQMFVSTDFQNQVNLSFSQSDIANNLKNSPWVGCGILWIRMGWATSTDGGITGQHIAFGYCCSCCCCLSLWFWKNLAATQYSLPVTRYFCCFLLFFRVLSAVCCDLKKKMINEPEIFELRIRKSDEGNMKQSNDV